MLDVPPTWYKKLQEKCEKEPDKIEAAEKVYRLL